MLPTPHDLVVATSAKKKRFSLAPRSITLFIVSLSLRVLGGCDKEKNVGRLPQQEGYIGSVRMVSVLTDER